MLHRLVLLSALCGLVVRAAPATEQSLEKQIVLVASPARFADEKQVYEIPRSDVFVNVKFGAKDNSPNVTALLTLESRSPEGPTTSWIYGTSCTGQGCPSTGKYDEAGKAGSATKTGTGFTGKWFTDTVTIGANAKLSASSFVALSQFYQNEQYAGVLSLGIGNAGQNVDQLFSVGKDPWITIYTGTSNDGQLVIGRNGHDKCNGAAMWAITGDAWDVEKTTIEVDGGNKKDNQRLAFSITTKTTIIPADSYKVVLADAKVTNGQIEDISKLKTIKITIGSNSWTIKPEDITYKNALDGKYYLQLDQSTDNNPAITLGVPFLTNRCLVLNGQGTDKTKWQVGVGDPKSGAGVFGLSALLLGVVSAVHVFRL